jgi:thiamine-monophosphate kinase
VNPRGRVRLGIGDDACVLKDGTVLSTDAYCEGVHFDPAYMSYRDIGMRCACAAISDVVAMTARPEVLLVALALPAGFHSSRVRSLYRGIEDACAATGCEVAGGDVIGSDRLLLAFTASGKARRPRLRSDARPGDGLYVTGHVGLAETGRLALAGGLPRRGFGNGIRRHLAPVPRLAAAGSLAKRMHALIDTSDGLATDARHIAEASGVKATLEADRLPIHRETLKLCDLRKTEPLRFALSTGEDYELLFSSPHCLGTSVKGTALTRIGRVERGSGLFLERNGTVKPVRFGGYDHLSRK